MKVYFFIGTGARVGAGASDKTTLSRSKMGWLRNTEDRTDAKQVGWIDARHDGCLTGWMDRGKTGRMLNRLDGWMQDSKEASH